MFDPFNKVKILERPHRIVVDIKQNYYAEISNIISDARANKKNKIIELYFFLYAMNMFRIKRINRDILLNVLSISGHREFDNYVKVLVSHDLLLINKVHYHNLQYQQNEYQVKSYNISSNNNSNKSIKIEYKLSDILIKILYNHKIYINLSSSDLPPLHNIFSGIIFHITSSDINTCNENKQISYPDDLYLKRYMHRYTELTGKFDFIDKNLKILPTYNANEHRWYHYMHMMKKEEREYFLRYEGEEIKEYWDLHNAAFVYLYFLAAKHHINDSELNEYKKLVLSGHLYEDVMDYICEKGIMMTDREYIKGQLQKYLTFQTYKRMKSSNNDTSQYYIDKFFNDKFPSIRELILSSDVVYEEDLAKPRIKCVSKNGKQYFRKPVKPVKTLKRNYMPYEEQLILFGICKRLEENYGIKTLTIHDAIYFKVSDMKKVSVDDVNRILNEEIEYLYWKLHIGKNNV